MHFHSRSLPFLLLLALPFSLKAQSFLGIRAGALSATITDGSHASDGLLGFHGGPTFVVRPNGPIGFATELLFMQKGGREEASFYGFSTEDRMTISYLELPFLLRVAVGGNKEKLLLSAGPYLAYALHVRDEYTGSSATRNVHLTTNGSPDEFNVESLDTGVLFAVGL